MAGVVEVVPAVAGASGLPLAAGVFALAMLGVPLGAAGAALGLAVLLPDVPPVLGAGAVLCGLVAALAGAVF